MKAYMAYAGDPAEGAALVFAHDRREAKHEAWPLISSWTGGDYIDLRVNLIKDSQYLFDTEADKVKLAADIAHVIDCPRSCERCEQWGKGEFDERGICPECLDEEEFWE